MVKPPTCATGRRAVGMTERDWQRRVVDYARIKRWAIMHTRPAMKRSGEWATPIMGQPGFPDLTMVRRGRLVFAELKAVRGRLTVAQRTWLVRLRECPGVEVYLWRPEDWGEVQGVLT